MTRRGLLNEADRKRFFEAPVDDASLIRLYSLSDEDRDFVLSKRGARNQLGMAVQSRHGGALRDLEKARRIPATEPARHRAFRARPA